MDTKAPVPILGMFPPIGGNFQMNQPDTMGIGTFELMGQQYGIERFWRTTNRAHCRVCKTRRFMPKVFGMCADCFADRLAVVRHEERLAA